MVGKVLGEHILSGTEELNATALRPKTLCARCYLEYSQENCHGFAGKHVALVQTEFQVLPRQVFDHAIIPPPTLQYSATEAGAFIYRGRQEGGQARQPGEVDDTDSAPSAPATQRSQRTNVALEAVLWLASGRLRPCTFGRGEWRPQLDRR